MLNLKWHQDKQNLKWYQDRPLKHHSVWISVFSFFVSKFPWRSWFDDDGGHAFDAIEAAKEAIARCLGLHFLMS